MAPHRFYIRQLSFNGSTYTTGSTYDSLERWGMACKEFPFTLYPEPKPSVTIDWIGEDGLDVYSPSTQRLKEYDIEVEFIINSERLFAGGYESLSALSTAVPSPHAGAFASVNGATFYVCRSEGTWTANTFEDNEQMETAQMATAAKEFIKYLYGRTNGSVGSLLAVYDEYTMIGRKDVKVKSVKPDAYEWRSGGNEALASFKVVFTVYDPVTEVALTAVNGSKELTFS